MNFSGQIFLLFVTIILTFTECLGLIGGRNASTNQFPFIVSLQNNAGFHINAGSIIGKNYVVTDAYTLHPDRGALLPIRVLAGTTTLSGPGISYHIKKMAMHPRYDEINFFNNIGLIEIGGYGFMFTTEIQPIPLGTVKVEANTPVIAAGWGLSEHSHEMRTNELKFATLLTTDEYQTDKLFKDTIYEDNPNYLHGFGYEQTGAMACQWDMGGPIIAGYTLVGIITWDLNRTCSYQSHLPTSALRIAPHIYWINEIVYHGPK